ncbi:uncharacterized protein LOC131245801 [Magnolia sinica]|uniref:uncharacterized protein LOC131245801 n=1 Tax=Magnolia sinica TaxID=86752 RepID=UPI002659E952|nr:uncharacterized protein LOC131245801 [Magnolia sinica]
MASACVKNIGMSPDGFPAYPSYGWLSPRISLSRDLVDDGSKIAAEKPPSPSRSSVNPQEKPDIQPSGKDLVDFEFRLDVPVTMLPADELFFDGKLVPLQLASVRLAADSAPSDDVRSPESTVSGRRAGISRTDPYVFSPKAPRCSSRWKELLGLKKLQTPDANPNPNKPDLQKSASVPSRNPNPKPDLKKSASMPSKNSNTRSLKHFLHRSSKCPPIDSNLTVPLLRDSDSSTESVSISSRLSLSLSSSVADQDDLPRLSLHSDKSNPKNHPKVRVSRQRAVSDHTARIGRSPLRRPRDSNVAPVRGVSVDSPRMNSSGKIVFQSLERSSSSPGSFNGGSRNTKHRGIERSYSSNVRVVTPVLNVPVCSLRGSAFGLGQLFSPQKRDGARSHGKTRNDRI